MAQASVFCHRELHLQAQALQIVRTHGAEPRMRRREKGVGGKDKKTFKKRDNNDSKDKNTGGKKKAGKSKADMEASPPKKTKVDQPEEEYEGTQPESEEPSHSDEQ
eukprot:7293955-Pyramimonas_sp.AAC.1